MARAKRVSLMYVRIARVRLIHFAEGVARQTAFATRFKSLFFPAPRENPPRKTLHGRHKPVHLI